MISIDETSTIGETFLRAAEAYADHAFLAVPANPARHYAAQGSEMCYAEAERAVRRLTACYQRAGYGLGHRVALMLENRPEHLLHKLAMNALGICCVPLNPDHRPRELAYVVDHAKVDLVLFVDRVEALVRGGLALASHRPAALRLERFVEELEAPLRRADSVRPDAHTPASVLYTSGTTGRPKGCVLSHGYELAVGAWYASSGGLTALAESAERFFNPLPLFHVNASVLSFFCAMLTGNCQVQTDRFQTARWWTEVRESRATVIHYLGVMVPMLMSAPMHPGERDHQVRFAIGAGVDPQRHAMFEQRFGFPLIEIWGMTEMVRAIIDNEAPRQVGTRAFGRVRPGIEARVVDGAESDVPDGVPGELLVRHSAAQPRCGFFSGYLDDDAATAQAWRGDWFHTGDIVTRDADGLLHFVERRKNIIRRSGENIAAAEVEALLQSHPLVEEVAVVSVPDEMREEEVLACVVLRQGVAAAAVARELFDFCHGSLAYYKAPGWIWFADAIPKTATQKVQKHQIFPEGVDPRTMPGIIDLRGLKRR